jgi:hypothetical protein
MLLRYNIVTERETADAVLRADAYLSTQPQGRHRGKAYNFGAPQPLRGRKSLPLGVGSSGRIRTEEPPPTPTDSIPPDPRIARDSEPSTRHPWGWFAPRRGTEVNEEKSAT